MAIPSATTTYDTQLEAVITTASRVIDADTEREFFSTSATRYYTADDSLSLFISDDIQSITTLETLSSASAGIRTYGYSWQSYEYDLEPENGPPYTRVIAAGTGRYLFPRDRRGVKITGVFGYCPLANVPFPIQEACLLLSQRYYERSKSPMGMIGGGDMTEAVRISKVDPDYTSLIADYKRIIMIPTASWGA
jgi:hypothetical protein